MAVEFLTPAGLGLEVELPSVGKALKQLWKEGEGVATRASLVNLVIYSEGEDSLDANSTLAAEITRDHACRVILVERHEKVQETPHAWITAHCHVSRAGAKQICCEQIAYRLGKGDDALLANTVLGNLDSDLPLVLWWQGPLPATATRQLWSRVDRLVFDSAEWFDGAEQVQRIKQIQETSADPVTLCDINWGRLLALRLALAQLHDQPGAAQALGGLHRLEIHHGGKNVICPAMLSAWLCRQLGWELSKTAEGARLTKAEGTPCEVVFVGNGEEDCAVTKVVGSGGYHFTAELNATKELVLGRVELEDGHRFQLTAPGGRQTITSLVSQELERGSEHRIYPQILEIASPLLA